MEDHGIQARWMAEGAVMGWVIVIVLAILLIIFLARARRNVIRTPEALTRHALGHFYEVTEKELAQCEMAVKRARGNHPDAALLYALRVSKCVPTLKSFKTLGSRWTVANCGAGASGLQMGALSENGKAVRHFLATMYCQRLDELCAVAITKARELVAKRKSKNAKINVVRRVLERIASAKLEFVYELPGAESTINRHMKELEAIAEQIEAGHM